MPPRDLTPILDILNASPPSACAAFGAPRQGKTTIAAQIFWLLAHPAVFINWQRERILDEYEDVVAVHGEFNEVAEVLKSWEEPSPPKVNWVPPASENIDGLAAKVSAALSGLYQSNIKNPGNPRLAVFCDEAQFYGEKNSAVETLAIAGPRFGLQIFLISQFPERLENRRLLGALTGGFILMWLDKSQLLGLQRNYGFTLPEDLEAWCAIKSYRAYYNSMSAGWIKVGDGSGDGEEPGEPEEDEEEAEGERTPAKSEPGATAPANSSPAEDEDEGGEEP